MTHILRTEDFVNENKSRRITNDDGVFHSVDEILDDWRRNGHNKEFCAEDMCYEFDKDYDDFREELLGKMTDDDLVLMMTKIHYPPLNDFVAGDFIKVLCQTSELREGEGDIEDTFGVDPYQTYTFGGDFEGTAQLNDDLEDCLYGYTSINDLNKKSCKNISKVTDYILNNVKAEIYYADRVRTWSYKFKSDDLYIYEHHGAEYQWSARWLSKNIKMYVADLQCGGDPDTHLILCCEN
jgi:hypothetical protein